MLRTRGGALVSARKWAVSIIGSVVGAELLTEAIKTAVVKGGGAYEALSIVLLGTTLCLIGLWIWSSQKELDLCFEWLDPKRYEPPSSGSETVHILALAVFLLALLYCAARYPLVYSLLFAGYCIIDWIAARTVTLELRAAIEGSRERARERTTSEPIVECYAKGIAILDRYYLQKPHGILRVVRLLLAIVALALASAFRSYGRPILSLLNYVLLIGTIIGTEVVIMRWRQERDRAIRPLTADLTEYDRQRRGEAESAGTAAPIPG
jgi:hypothetical protein